MSHMRAAKTAIRPVIAAAAIISVLILGLITGLSIHVIGSMRDAANRIDAEHAVTTVDAVLASLQRRIALTVKDNASWDEAYLAIESPDPLGWIIKNWGVASANSALYDGVLVLGPGGAQVAAYYKGQPFDASSAFAPETLHRWQALATNTTNTPQPMFTRLIDQTAIAATGSIELETGAAAQRGYTLTLFKTMNADLLAQISKDMLLEGLQISKYNGKPGRYVIHDMDRTPLASLTWTDRHPGDEIYNNLRTKIYAIYIFVILSIVWIIWTFRHVLRAEKLKTASHYYNSTHDHLTGLLNRRGLLSAFEAGDAEGIVYMIDLDNFKCINDAWGHAIGDQLILLASERLRTLEDKTRALARLSGDKFGLLVLNCIEPAAFGRHILKLLREPFFVSGRTIEISASIGSARYTSEVIADEAIRRADVALHFAKDNGRGQVALYTPAFDVEREELAEAENYLRQAIRDHEIHVVFQPLVSAENGIITGVEALARWKAEIGSVSPEVFIPLAEKSGLITSLSRIVLQDSIRGIIQLPHLSLSVNVSPIQLCDPDFPNEIKRILQEERFPPSRLILEVTEGVFVSRPDRAKSAMVALRMMGVRFAMDDFGTGNASIGTLRNFEFDKLKIDRSLMEEKNRGIFHATIQLASALGIPVTAEGIETEAQAEIARAAGCELLQGYWIGKPKAPDEFAKWLSQLHLTTAVAV